MIRALYSAAMWALRPLLRRKMAQRAVAESGYGHSVEERFGNYIHIAQVPDAAHPLVWLHAVSLGETRAAAVFVAELRLQLPGMRLLLTHGTATGREAGKSLLQEGDMQVWQPWDDAASVRRFLAHFQPRIGLLMETEVWPNLVWQSAEAGIPLCLVNARLSDKSLRAAQRVAWLSRSVFRALTAVWAQSTDDAQRLQQLGAPVRGAMGNFKFDATPDPVLLDKGRTLRAAFGKSIVLFSSSREGEEAMWLQEFIKKVPVAPTEQAQAAIKNRATGVQWLIVPRHPQRFDAVEKLLCDAGLRVARRSTWGDGPPTEADAWLGDSLGEMAMYYGMADVALLGGSFAPLGGQNLIEAAACGCPVIMGPHTFNFAQAADLAKEAGAAFELPDMAQAMDAAYALLAESQQLLKARQAASDLSHTHRGAAKRTAEAVRNLLTF